MEDWIIPLVGFLSALISSAVGFGGAMVMAPLLFFLLPPPQAVMTTALLASTTNLLIVSERREKHFDKKELIKLGLGTLPGMLLGVYLLQTISTPVALFITGVAIFTGVSLRLFLSGVAKRLPPSFGYLIGLGSGVLATTIGLAALAPAWFIVRDLSAQVTRDSLNLYYLFTGGGTFLLGLIFLGTTVALPPWWSLLLGVGAVIIGQKIGQVIFQKIATNHQRYVRISLLLLLAIALVAILRGLLSL